MLSQVYPIAKPIVLVSCTPGNFCVRGRHFRIRLRRPGASMMLFISPQQRSTEVFSEHVFHLIHIGGFDKPGDMLCVVRWLL